MRPFVAAVFLSVVSLAPIAALRLADVDSENVEPPPPASTSPAKTAAGASIDGADAFLGVIRAGEVVDVTPKIEAKLRDLFFRTGSRVTKGTVLARLDTRALSEDLSVARANLAEVQARLQEAAGKLRRRRSLSRWAGVAREELDEARAQVRVMEAQVNAQKTRVAQLQHNIDDAELRAPFDGVVALTYASPGALVSPGKPVLRLLSEGEVEVRFAVPENRARGLAVGDAVRVDIDRLDLSAGASVTSVAPEIDSGSHMIYALARLDSGTVGRERMVSGTVVRVRTTPPARTK